MRSGDESVRWHVWRIDAESFGVQNLGARTVTRVSVESERNEVIVNGYLIKKFVRPLEWFIVVIPRDFQGDCEGCVINCRSGRSRISQSVKITDAIRSQPSPYRIDAISNHPEGDVFQPPISPY